MDLLWAFLRKWAGPLVVIAVFVVLVAILWSYSGPPSVSRQQAWPWWIKWVFYPLLVALLLALVIGFLYLFTGDVDQKRIHWMIRYCYLFTILSLLTPVLPLILSPFLPKLYEVMLQSPVGIVAGCSKPLKEDSKKEEPKWPPKELQCNKDTDQWVVNIGGTIETEVKTATSQPAIPEKEPARSQQDQGGGTQIASTGCVEVCLSVPVKIRGGLVVPLYFVVLSLMGGAVSMTRRVPEYQVRSTLPEGDEKHMTLGRVRESLVFQIMQVVSAPLIAVTAYFLVEPATRGTSVALGFTSGFASETVLMTIRALVEKLKPTT